MKGFRSNTPNRKGWSVADFKLPVAFHFLVDVAGAGSGADDQCAFQEVSGLEAEIKTEDVVEGGENRFQHRLPKGVTRSNIVLKRGLAKGSNPLVKWCKDVFENDFSKPIEPRAVTVSLLDEEHDALCTWSIQNAYPVKWSVGGFDAMKNEIAIETIELAYTRCKRTI